MFSVLQIFVFKVLKLALHHSPLSEVQHTIFRLSKSVLSALHSGISDKVLTVETIGNVN